MSSEPLISHTKSSTSDTENVTPLLCRLFGYPLHASSASNALQVSLNRHQSGLNTHVVTLNPEMLMQGDATPELGEALRSADVVIPDGAGVVWALNRYQTDTHYTRAPGIELAEGLLDQCHQHQWPVALIGAAPEVLEQTVSGLQKKFPRLNIVFHHHGFFDSPEHEADVAQQCIKAQPQLVLVALGVPKQELWIRRHYDAFTKPTLLVGVGGSFDVWSGTKKRAPWLFRALQCEWLYRITSEPWRIQRVMKTLPAFAGRVLRTPAHTALEKAREKVREKPQEI